MSEVSPTRETSMETDQEEHREEQDAERGGHRLEFPEDGFQWKKYGQKFVKNIGKFRSYFKCPRPNCMAKKRVDWSTSGDHTLRVVYDGVHTHAPLGQESGSSSQGTSNPNQYNLLSQVLRDQTSNRSQHD